MPAARKNLMHHPGIDLDIYVSWDELAIAGGRFKSPSLNGGYDIVIEPIAAGSPRDLGLAYLPFFVNENVDNDECGVFQGVVRGRRIRTVGRPGRRTLLASRIRCLT